MPVACKPGDRSRCTRPAVGAGGPSRVLLPWLHAWRHAMGHRKRLALGALCMGLAAAEPEEKPREAAGATVAVSAV